MGAFGIVVGLVLLTLGGDLLVRGASRIAAAFGVPPLVVGLTVVAFGTSAPELAVSCQSSLAGRPDVALGNVVGSNIFNVLFILGVSALVAPLVVSSQLVRVEVPLLILVSGLAWAAAADGVVGRGEGAALFGALLVYVVWSLRAGLRETRAGRHEARATPHRTPRDAALVVLGLGLLTWGADVFVAGAVDLARRLGMSELVIGLTIVAGGTSLPEVAASVVASVRGERDIAVGNVIGSNLFNLMCVLGLAAAVSPAGVSVAPGALSFDLPVMCVIAFACLPVFFTGHRIDRWEGLAFLGYYALYAAYLVLRQGGHAGADALAEAVLTFVAPLTALTLAITLVRAARARRRRGAS